MGKLVTVVLLALLCSGCLVGDVWSMSMSAGEFEFNMDNLKVGFVQDFKSGQNFTELALPALEKDVMRVPVTLSIAGIGKEAGVFSFSGLSLGGTVSVDGKALAERMHWKYRLPEPMDLGLSYSKAHSVEIFGLFVSMKF